MSPERPIDRLRYVSTDFLELERAKLWPKVWLVAAHASELSQPGSFVTLDMGAESFLVVRDQGSLRAFHNVCIHRGTILCEERRGRAPALRCPYHGFTYGLDGKVVAGRGSEKLVSAGMGLAPLACEQHAGLVWVRAAQAGPSLDEYLGPLDAALNALDLEAFTLVADHTYPLACNWKLSADIHNEALHLPTLHPELAAFADFDAIRWESLGIHSGFTIPLRVAPGVKRQLYVFPNTQLNVTGDDLEIYRHRPHATSPLSCELDELRLVRSQSPRRETSDVRHERLDPARVDARTAMGQDIAIASRVQRGLLSSGFQGLRLGPLEDAIAHMHAGITAFVGAQK